MKRVKVYSVYERLWHWLQALAIILLLFTGLEIHAPDRLHVLGFARAVRVHEIIALLVVLNAFLSLFYHLTTGALRKFIPEPKDFFSLALAQARYYAYGIIKGLPHPVKGTRHHAFNPLQQITYVVILNIALPIQVITGALIWWAPSWPLSVKRIVGGLGPLTRVHMLAAWFFAAFIVLHIYLSTTGSSPLAYFKAMIFGWEEEPERSEAGTSNRVPISAQLASPSRSEGTDHPHQ